MYCVCLTCSNDKKCDVSLKFIFWIKQVSFVTDVRHVTTFIKTSLSSIAVTVQIHNMCEKHLYVRIISRREVWAHKTSLTPPLFIKVPVPSLASEWSCNYVLELSILPFLRFYYCILELFRQCDVFVFHYIAHCF